MPDFLTLVQDLQREIGVQGAPVSTVIGQTGMRSKMVNWIADADIFIQSMHLDWKFLWAEYQQATVASNANPPKPADLNIWDRESFFLDYSTKTHKALTTLEYLEWRQVYRQGTKTDKKPHSIVIKPDNSLILEPPPDAVYSLTGDYWKKPTKMTANTEVSAIPDEFHRVILLQAKLWYAEEQEIPVVYKAADRELNGDPAKRMLGELARLESSQLPGQEGRTMGQSPDMTIVVE